MFNIEKGVPLPLPHRPVKPRKYPFAEMEVGDSVFIPTAYSQLVGNAARGPCYAPMKFTVRTVTENNVKGVRVWRVA